MIFNYGALTSAESRINRVKKVQTNINGTITDVVEYARTGGGKTKEKTWGDNKIKLNYATAGATDQFGRIKVMA